VAVALLYVALGVPGFHADGFLIFLKEKADLSAAAIVADPIARRARVHQTLVETAERSQSPLRAELERRGVRYRPHYLINMIEVQARPGLRRTFANWPGVDSVLFQPGVRRYPRSLELPSLDPGGTSGVEWNVREIGADRVWDLGYTGQEVIVGDADTGVTWDHPALKDTYLGWSGETAVHDYHWYDSWDGQAEPWDDNGHGTHTTGTVVGLDGDNKVGVAPGARWIACRNMRHGIGNPGSYVSCMEFLFAPFPLDGDPFRDGDPARGAHVVNNSWGCPQEEGCLPETLRPAMENLHAAGQMMVVSAGNEGPTCNTVQDPPAIYDSVFSVGAITQSDKAASFSSRGPVTVDDSQRSKPDIVAPGVDIRSSVPDGYASLPGTSMAGPHVTGAVVLLWSVDPGLIGDIEGTEAILAETAQALRADMVCASEGGEPGMVCTCGDDNLESVPNQVYGWGQVDVWAAVQMLLKRQPP
jgi:subtilisin family serine protease